MSATDYHLYVKNYFQSTMNPTMTLEIIISKLLALSSTSCQLATYNGFLIGITRNKSGHHIRSLYWTYIPFQDTLTNLVVHLDVLNVFLHNILVTILGYLNWMLITFTRIWTKQALWILLHTNCHLEWSEERREWWIQIISDYKLQPLSQFQENIPTPPMEGF